MADLRMDKGVISQGPHRFRLCRFKIDTLTYIYIYRNRGDNLRIITRMNTHKNDIFIGISADVCKRIKQENYFFDTSNIGCLRCIPIKLHRGRLFTLITIGRFLIIFVHD